jgi:hypothetical protein
MFYLDRTDSYKKQCTFENGLCSWVILSEINQTCQFEIVSGLDAALSKRKALYFIITTFAGGLLVPEDTND